MCLDYLHFTMYFIVNSHWRLNPPTQAGRVEATDAIELGQNASFPLLITHRAQLVKLSGLTSLALRLNQPAVSVGR